MTSEMASDIFKNVLSSSPSKQGKNIAALADEDVHTVRYWLYAPGEGSCMWDEFYTSGIMAIGWGEIGDLSTFDSKDAMKIKMREVIDESLSYKNAAHATWQFANEMKIGDIVFVKKGMHQIIGRGVVMSDYEYDDTRDDEYKNIRQVDWTHNGEWPHPGQAVMKTLTDITSYTDYVEKLNSLFEDETEEDAEDVEKTYPPYTKEDFLSEVFMPEEEYEKLSGILRIKKNIILQGAPGVGKTFAAKGNYADYMTTEPINCNEELQRVKNADYELCTALLTAILREDHFSNGSFEYRQRAGQVDEILKRMVAELNK